MSGGIVIGSVAILHVIIAHFAIGSGFLIVAAESIGRSRGDDAFLDFAERNSYLLVLFSIVLGALTGVGIWSSVGLSYLLITHVASTLGMVWMGFLLAAPLMAAMQWWRFRRTAHLLLQ